MVELAMFSVQRVITPKVEEPMLWFTCTCSARRPMVLYICVKFYENISNGFQLTERTWVHGGNGYVQSAITPEESKRELRFMCSARCLIVLYICVMCCENITNGIRVMEWTRVHGRIGYVQCSKGNNSKSRQTGVMVHVFCRSSYGALHLCEILWKKISNGIRVIERTWIYEALTDGRTLKISDGIT